MSLSKFFSSRNVTLFSFLVFTAYLLFRAALIFYPQPDIGGVEVNIVYFIQRLLDGRPLYTNPELAPYAIAQYSPFYYYLVAGTGKLLGIKPDDVFSIFILSRSISLFLNLFYMRVVYLIARKGFAITRRRSFIAAALAFIFLEITSYSRPDSLNHVFFMLSLYFFIRNVKDEEVKNTQAWIILSAIFASLALFSKQTSFVLPVVITTWLLLHKKYRQLFLFGAGYAVTTAIILLLVYITTDFSLFYKNVVRGIDNGIGWGWFRLVILPDFYFEFGMLFIPVFIIVMLLLKKESKPLLKFSYTVLLLLFFLFNTVALKNGSNPGYFTEWWTFLFILTAFYWPIICETASVIHKKIPAILVSFVLLMKLTLLFKPVNRMSVLRPYKIAYAEYTAEKELAAHILRKLEPGDEYVVFDNYYTPESYMSCFLFRHSVMPQMDIVALATYPRKKYNYDEFRTALLQGRFKWMLMKTTGPQKRFFGTPLDKYELEQTTGWFNLYHYKP